jgi:phosphoglycerol transferase
MKTVKKLIYILIRVLNWPVFVLAVLLLFSHRWMVSTWNNMTFEELTYQLRTLGGTGGGMFGKYALNCILPTALIFAAALAAMIFACRRWKSRKALLHVLSLAAGVLLLGLAVFRFWTTLDISGYIDGQKNLSTFADENYADPHKVKVTFPEKKRNLIYIFMESMEVTEADRENGGGTAVSMIPELTKIAQENEDFSGTDKTLDGGFAMPGATWTMGAMFAQTSGLPLSTGLEQNLMETQDSFFPKIRTLGDILHDEGYKQVLLLGSDATFGGRKLYFTEHGGYEMHDYNYAKEKGLIPSDYFVWWGYEDEKLYKFAKDEVTDLAKSDEPFNLTMLTVDTHMETGYQCELCPDTFDDPYANSFACASKQVSDFLEWAKEQPWYDNTTIVVSGDHPTMTPNFPSDLQKDYVRKVYTAYINSAVQPDPSMGRRDYTTFDDYPTTLAALGAKIDGERLGLGTNLFSTKKTLSEEYGRENEQKELERGSALIKSLEQVTLNDAYKKAEDIVPRADLNLTAYDADTKNAQLEISNIQNVQEKITQITGTITDESGKNGQDLTFALQENGTYTAAADLSAYTDNKEKITVSLKTSTGEAYTIADEDGDLSLDAHRDFSLYLTRLGEMPLDGRTVLITGVGDCTSALNEYDDQRLSALGIKATLSTMDGTSFAAVIDEDGVQEKEDSAPIEMDGTLKGSSIWYKITSDGQDAKNGSIIMATEKKPEGEDVSSNGSGLRFMVLDNATGSVLDSAVFDTAYKDKSSAHAHVVFSDYKKSLLSSSVKLTVSDVHLSCEDVNASLDSMSVSYWSAKDPASRRMAALNDSNGTYTATIPLNGIDPKDFRAEILATDTQHIVYTVQRVHTDLRLMTCDMDDYLTALAKVKDQYTILLSVKGDAGSIPDDVQKDLNALGLSGVLQGGQNLSYLAVLDRGNVLAENISYDELTAGAMLPDESALYEVKSAGADVGDESMIRLNGTDYSLNQHGLNIVVWNPADGTVADAVTCDPTNAKSPMER